MYFWLVYWSISYPDQYCSLRLSEMLASYNFPRSLLFMVVPWACALLHQSFPPAVETPVFIACPALVDPTPWWSWGEGWEHHGARMPCIHTALMQGSVVLFEWTLIDLLFGWFPFLKLLPLTIQFFSLLLEKLLTYARSSVLPPPPFYQSAFWYLSTYPRVLSGVKLVIKTQHHEVYRMEMKSILCSGKDSLCW